MNFLLLLHLVGATIFGVQVLVSILSVISGWLGKYKQLSVGLGFVTTYLIATGSLLSVNANMELGAYCNKIFFYFATFIFVEIMLFFAMKKKEITFPFHQIGLTQALSFSIILFTGAKLF